MKRKMMLNMALLAATTPALAQTIYKCPSPVPGAPAVYQQMPCSPTGGGEALAVKSIPAGAGSGLSEDAKKYMAERDQYWTEKQKADDAARKRQEDLAVERGKVRAAEEQAAAQRATAAAIWATGWRR